MEITIIKEREYGESENLYKVGAGSWIFRSIESANAFIALVQGGNDERTAYRKIAWGHE